MRSDSYISSHCIQNVLSKTAVLAAASALGLMVASGATAIAGPTAETATAASLLASPGQNCDLDKPRDERRSDRNRPCMKPVEILPPRYVPEPTPKPAPKPPKAGTCETGTPRCA